MATATPEILGPDVDEQETEYSDSSLSAIEEADRSHMIRTAKANPRSITNFVAQLTEIACYSRETAMEMMYSLPRDGKQLVGPSIGFAEAALAVWGNARAWSEVIEQNAREGFVVAQGSFYDCERNVGRAIRKRRRVVAKKITGDSLQVTGDAACSIATREAILRSIPKPLWRPVWLRAKETAVGDVKSVEQIRMGLVDTFRKMGVPDVRLLNALQVQGIPDIGGDEIIAMQSWKNQLAERQVTIEDIFGSPEDDEIEAMMEKLQWTPSKRTMAWNNYKGRRADLLAYIRKEAEAAGISVDKPKTEEQKPAAAPAAETKTEAAETKQPATNAQAAPTDEKKDNPPRNKKVSW